MDRERGISSPARWCRFTNVAPASRMHEVVARRAPARAGEPQSSLLVIALVHPPLSSSTINPPHMSSSED
eukprot:4783904-Pyramimonas_sp.AAC.1